MNISVRWVDPIDWSEESVEGTLCATCYKINNADRDDFDRGKRETLDREWGVSFGDDQYTNAAGIVYIPVETGAELQAATETLRDHFAEFGEY